tara:strand:+ start:133 stop:1830 length:1698 start_codon:yes stop_codon:yes gene_type:complete
MIHKRIDHLRTKFDTFKIDGYIVPKNDEYFSEYAQKDRLKYISNFSGSAGYAILLKKKNYLFVDSRYTIQAELESKKNFIIEKYENIFNCQLFKNLIIGFDPKLFTSRQISNFFLKFNSAKKIDINLVDSIFKKKVLNYKSFYSLKKSIIGETHQKKIKKISHFLKKNNSDFLFVSSPENVAWLLNIRGYDNPNSPTPNCRLLLSNKGNYFIICEKKKLSKLIREKKIKKLQIIEPEMVELLINKIKGNKIIVDDKSCSIFYENLFKKKFKVIKKKDPIYLFKSIKNKYEIKNMIQSHISDGVALTKFLHWIKIINKRKITEYEAQKKLESFRRLDKNYLFPSFNTIAGAGKNGAIVHYRAHKNNSKKINKNDIFLCDSGGQYKYGTTDVTRTICFTKQKNFIKNIFTRVLKGHIAVANTNLKKYNNGKKIDILARKDLRKVGLNYGHGTGHGVGFFSNVHEGPQAISKFNKIKISEGMIISNEPGFYKKGKFGIRIENLVYVKKIKKKIFFENLTFAPIEKELINFKLLNSKEKDYLFKYHLLVYEKIAKYLNKNQKRWLASII